MKREFIPYAQALALQELGFNEPCFGSWFNYEDKNIVVLLSENIDGWYDHYADNLQVASPLYRQAFRWFRDKHQLEGEVRCITFNSERLKGYQYAITSKNYQSFEQLGDYYAYEYAELICLKKLIEIAQTH